MAPIGFIGPNKCGLESDIMNISCSIKYTGNIAPALRWQTGYVDVPTEQVQYVMTDGMVTASILMSADTHIGSMDDYVCLAQLSTRSMSSQSAVSRILQDKKYLCYSVPLRILGKSWTIYITQSNIFPLF